MLRAMPDEKDPRVITPIPKPLLARIDDYRFENRLPSRSEAIRRLIETGLGKAAAVPGEAGSGGARKPRSTAKSAAPRKAPERKGAPSSKLDQIRALREGAG